VSLNVGMTSLDYTSIFPNLTTYYTKNWNDFVLIAGKSIFKNQHHLVDNVWANNPYFPTLNVIARGPTSKNLSNVKGFYGFQSTMTTAKILYQSGVHLCTSMREGFGHYINEARAMGALVCLSFFRSFSMYVLKKKLIIVGNSNQSSSHERTHNFGEWNFGQSFVDSLIT
jgi:hypothetical protein